MKVFQQVFIYESTEHIYTATDVNSHVCYVLLISSARKWNVYFFIHVIEFIDFDDVLMVLFFLLSSASFNKAKSATIAIGSVHSRTNLFVPLIYM